MWIAALVLALQPVAAETSACPDAAEVQARVRTILSLAPEVELRESFSVHRTELGLEVKLHSAEGALIGERTLPLDGSCVELAQASAVVLAAWLRDMHPSFAAELPRAAAARAHAEFEPEAAPRAEPANKPPFRMAPPELPLASTAAAPPAPAFGFETSVGLGADITSGSAAFAGVLSAELQPARRGLGTELWAKLSSARTRELAPGNVVWRRWSSALGPSFRIALPPLRWDIGAGLAVHGCASRVGRTRRTTFATTQRWAACWPRGFRAHAAALGRLPCFRCGSGPHAASLP